MQSKAERMEEVVPKKEKVWAQVQRPQSAEGVCAHERCRRRKKKEGETVWYRHHSHGRTSRSGTGSWLSPQHRAVGVSPGNQRRRESWL